MILLLGLVPPLLWAIINHIDKYLLSRYFKSSSVQPLIVVSSLIGLVALLVVYLIDPTAIQVSVLTAIVIMATGTLTIISYYPYLYALQQDEASVVVPLYQTIPVFAYVLGYIVLHETLTIQQIIAALIILFAAVLVSLHHHEGKIRFKATVFWAMMLASFLSAVAVVLFKYFAISTSFHTALFWEYSGFAVIGLVLLLISRDTRAGLGLMFRENKAKIIAVNFFSELLNVAARVVMAFVSLSLPVSLTYTLNGFQPLYSFLIGVGLTTLLPHLGQEKLNRSVIAQKLTAIVLMFVGLYLLA